MSKLDCSFHDHESAVDLGSIIADFANADEDNSARVPVKKLADLFDNCASKNEDGMKVYLRVRPSSKPESTIFVESEQTIVTNAPDSSKRALYTKTESRHYMFTRVFDSRSEQTEVFENVAKPLFNRFLSGENSVILSYGMTNAGKTYTIQGSAQNPGILPRLVTKILDHVSMHSGWALHASMLEVYQENIYDLLGKKREKLSIRDGNGKVEVSKLSIHPISSTQDSFRLMDIAASKRSKSSTFLNTGSSRSHAVYTLTLTRPTDDGRDIVSTAFQLVDLAGAERSNRTKATLIQQKEANNINTSLMQLWRCLQAVKRKNNDLGSSIEIVPFRESKLTHLLMPILGRAGLSGVAMIACVNPQIDDYDETLTILGNASLASKIREFNDVGRVAAQQTTSVVPPVTTAPVPVSVAPATNVTTVGTGAVRSIRMEDLKEYKDKNPPSTTSSAAGTKRKRNDSTSAMTVHHTKKSAASAAANNKVSTSSSTGHLHSGPSSTRTSVAETIATVASYDDSEADGGSERKRLRREVQSLREVNENLVQQSLTREADIRREVSMEMMTRSSHLLDQIQDLRRQLEQREHASMNDVTKSVKKAKRTRQQMQAEEDAVLALKEAEDELERVKAESEIEIFKLKTENFRLREELARYKPMQSSASKPKQQYVPFIAGGKNVAFQQDENNGENRSPNRSPASRSPANRSPLSPINSAKNSPNVASLQQQSAALKSQMKILVEQTGMDVENSGNTGYSASKGMAHNNVGNLSPQQRLRSLKQQEVFLPTTAAQMQQINGQGVSASGNGYFTRLRSQFTRA